MSINHIFIILGAFLLSIVTIRILTNLSLRKKLFVQQGISLVGGLSIVVSFFGVLLCSLLFLNIFSPRFLGVLLASAIIFIFALIDDWRELSVKAKFITQAAACSVLILFGIRTQIVNIGLPINIIITFIWVIGITNAFNLLDVLDGVTGVTGLIVGVAFFAISFLNKDFNTALFLLPLIGSLAGFLIYNLPPARVYMGNSGSHFLGFLFSAIAILISYAPLERKVALFSPLLVLGLPIFDTLFTILMRISKKKFPFQKTNDHLPLRLLAKGYSKQKALFCMSSLCLFFSVCGLLVSRLSNSMGLVIIAFVIFTSLLFTKMMSMVIVGESK